MIEVPAGYYAGSAELKLAVAVIFAFLLGSIPFGFIVVWLFFNVDIRTKGSGNIGAANTLRNFGRPTAAAVLILDALKGFGPAFVALHGGGPLAGVLAGGAAILGHCFSPWLRFKGGKGVATDLGVIFALAWPAGFAFMALWALGAFASGYSSVGSLAAALLVALPLWHFLGVPGLVFGLASGLFIVWTHRENLARLRAGRENAMGFRKRRAGGTAPMDGPV